MVDQVRPPPHRTGPGEPGELAADMVSSRAVRQPGAGLGDWERMMGTGIGQGASWGDAAVRLRPD